MFKTRLISGIVLLAIVIFALTTGGTFLWAFMTALSLIGLNEFFKAVKLDKTILSYITYFGVFGYEILLLCQLNEYIMIYSVICFIVMLACYVLSYPKFVSEQIALALFGFFYAGIMLSYVYQVRIGNAGIYSVWMIFIAAWGSDTCAYCTGMLIGKHKLPSKLSPKKTIEGCVGGIVGAGLIGFIYATILRDKLTTIPNPQLLYTIVGCVGSVIAQIGDLAASAVKRNHDIKDYGTLIPGHGGILDRFDSILFTAPVVYLLIQLFR